MIHTFLEKSNPKGKIFDSKGLRDLSAHAHSDQRERPSYEELKTEAFSCIGKVFSDRSISDHLQYVKNQIDRVIAFVSYIQAWPTGVYPGSEERTLQIAAALKKNGAIPNGRGDREWIKESMLPTSLTSDLRDLRDWIDENGGNIQNFDSDIFSPWIKYSENIKGYLENGISGDPANIILGEVSNRLESLKIKISNESKQNKIPATIDKQASKEKKKPKRLNGLALIIKNAATSQRTFLIDITKVTNKGDIQRKIAKELTLTKDEKGKTKTEGTIEKKLQEWDISWERKNSTRSADGIYLVLPKGWF